MRSILERVITNWRTTLAGLIGFVMCYLLYTGKITEEQFIQITAFCGSLGLMVTKDPFKKK